MTDVSLSNLPCEAGTVPGHWRVAFREPVNDSFAGCTFVEGVSVGTITGPRMRRLVALMGASIRAVLRVDGAAPMLIGDADAFRENHRETLVPEPPAPEPAPPAPVAAPAPPDEPAAPPPAVQAAPEPVFEDIEAVAAPEPEPEPAKVEPTAEPVPDETTSVIRGMKQKRRTSRSK